MRASKLPIRNFEYNTRRAEALARLDGYLEDLLHKEGRGTIGFLFDIPNELVHALGFDHVIDRTLKRIGEEMKIEFEVEFRQRGKEYYEAVAKDYFKRLKPRLQKIVKMFEDLGLVMDQTLLEQALVVAVSAFEVYLQELTASVIMLNPGTRKRFHPEIDRGIKLAKLEEYKLDVKRTQGEIVADLIRLDANSIKSVFSRLLDLQNVFNDKKTESKVCRIFETRNVIIHRAGLTDPKFKKVTKSRGAINTQIRLSRRFVLNSIKVLRYLAQRIETHIRERAR
jgi:hypothetical protein